MMSAPENEAEQEHSASHEKNDLLDAQLIEEGRLLFARPCTFLRSVTNMDDLLPDALTEVAFAGRSNVGKSSLLNALVGRHDMARVSQEPGRTRQLNFFEMEGRLMLADLPGYGYARAPKKEIAQWTKLTRDYLSGRASLRRVLLLVDARHGLQTADESVIALLNEVAVNFQIVLTKVDKLKKSERASLVADAAHKIRKHPAAHPVVILTSSRTGEGMEELRAALAALAA